MRFPFVLFVAILISIDAGAAALSAQEPVADWTFVPEYTLPGKAASTSPRVPHPQPQHELVKIESANLLFAGEKPTQRMTGLLAAESLPRDKFTIEAWILHHVDQPAGMLIAAKGKVPGESVPWALGFHNWVTSFSMQGTEGKMVQLQSRSRKSDAFKTWWLHLVASYDGDVVKIFINGEEVSRGHMHHDELLWPDQTELELAAYMNNEPYMQWANLVHRVRIWDQPLSEKKIVQLFHELQQPVEEGRLYDGLFHFTAGPYLNLSTVNSINVVWETDRLSKATIEWGKSAELGEKLELNDLSRLHEAKIEGLEPNTPYFYRVTCTEASKDTEKSKVIDSGLLTFKTAVEKGQPFKFAVIGDTEARPHINDRLCKLIWNERPNFVVNLGDLTDGGQKHKRFEWTHEYFVGVNQLFSRIPMFAVPGNGEGDLHWYKRYHSYPEPEGYYRFEFGDAAFFMLDSNQREEEFKPGGKQYEWLKKELANCDATWKFVCHHHATFTGEEDDYGNTWEGPGTFGDPAVQKIVPLYEEGNIDIAMFGHLHLYERSHPMRNGKVNFKEGTIHLLAGGGGGNLEDFAPTPAFFSAKTHRGHHYVLIEIANDKLTMNMHDTSGAIRDSFTLEKTESAKLKRTRNDFENGK